MDKKVIAIIAVVAIIVAAAAAFVLLNNNGNGGSGEKDTKETVTVTDLAGRQVEVSIPVERIVCGDAEAMTMIAAIAGESFKDKLVGYDSNFKTYYPDVQAMWESGGMDFSKMSPVGSFQDNTFSWEAVSNLNPDIVFIPMWCYKYGMISEDQVDKMAKAGIPVVNLDIYMQKLDVDVMQTNCNIIGTIFQNQTVADKVAAYYKTQVEKVSSKLSQVTPEKYTVYFEMLTALETYGNSNRIDPKQFLGQNGLVDGNTVISPEAFATSEVPYVFLATFRAYAACGENMGWGATVTQDDIKSIASSLNKRVGWSDAPAVKNGDVYLYNCPFTSSYECWFLYQLVAETMFPEIYADLDPVSALEGFYSEFLPWLDFYGVWYFNTAGEIGYTSK